MFQKKGLLLGISLAYKASEGGIFIPCGTITNEEKSLGSRWIGGHRKIVLVPARTRHRTKDFVFPFFLRIYDEQKKKEIAYLLPRNERIIFFQ